MCPLSCFFFLLRCKIFGAAAVQVASKRAEEILAEREEKASKEAAAGNAGAGKPKPLVKQAATELIRSFGSFSRLEVTGELFVRLSLRTSCMSLTLF